MDIDVFMTDSDGNGSLESRRPVPAIKFGAPGYELLEVPVPPDQSSLDVRLRIAAMLTIRVTTQAGALRSEWVTVRVESPPSFFLITTYDRLSWRALGNSQPVFDSHSFDFASARLSMESDQSLVAGAGPNRRIIEFRENPVRLSPVQSGMPISVFVRTVLEEEPVKREVELAPGEWRTLDVLLPGDFGRLSGRVVSEIGQPMPNARVTVARPGARHANEVSPFGSWRVLGASVASHVASQVTDAHGAFDFGAVPAGVFELSVEFSDYAAWVSKEHRVTRDAVPLTITMDPGVSITIKLVDAEGRPLPGASVWAVDRSRTSDAEGRVRFEHLPRGLVSFDTFFGGVRTSFPHDTSIPEPTFQIRVINR